MNQSLSSGKSAQLVAVVVTHNRLAKLKRTLARLCAEREGHLTGIILVNNASTDGTAEWLDTQTDPRLQVITFEQNRGGAAGFAEGMAAGVQRGADWLVVMDDDARPSPGAFAAFHRLPLDQWDGIAAAVYLPDGEIAEMNRPSRNPFWTKGGVLATLQRGRDGYHLPASAYEEDAGLSPVDVTSFVGFFVSVAAVKANGLPDAQLFIYGDDALYTLSLRKAGAAIAFAPQIRFEHDCETFAQGARMQPLWKVYYYHRNLLILYRMAAGWLFGPVLLVVLPTWLAKVGAYKGARKRFLLLLLRAIRDGLTGRKEVSFARVKHWAEGPGTGPTD